MALRVSEWVLFDLANESGYSCLLHYCLHGEPAGELIRTQPKGKGVAGDELKVVWRTLVLASIWAPRSSSSRTMITLPRLEAMCRGVMPFCRGGGVKPMCQRWSGGAERVKTASQTGGGTLPLAWSWHWRLCWAAAEPHSSFHSVQRCAAAWIQSWWGEREQKSSHWHWQWFWDCAENILYIWCASLCAPRMTFPATDHMTYRFWTVTSVWCLNSWSHAELTASSVVTLNEFKVTHRLKVYFSLWKNRKTHFANYRWLRLRARRTCRKPVCFGGPVAQNYDILWWNCILRKAPLVASVLGTFKGFIYCSFNVCSPMHQEEAQF